MIHVLRVEGTEGVFDGGFDGEGRGAPVERAPFGSRVVSGIAVDGDDDDAVVVANDVGLEILKTGEDFVAGTAKPVEIEFGKEFFYDIVGR